MSVNEKIKTIDKKIEQNKAQCNLDRQTINILALSSGNVVKCECLTGEDVLPEKGLLNKGATIKRSEDSLLGKELEAQNNIAKDQNKLLKEQKIKFNKFEKILKDKKNNGRSSNLVSVKSHGNDINLHSAIMKFLNAVEKVLKNIMDLLKHLLLLAKHVIAPINVMSINIGLLIKLIQEKYTPKL